MQPCLACPGDQKGLEVCLKMKPLWASVFMMLAMFLQSSAERAQRRWVRTALRPQAAPGHSRDLGQPRGRVPAPCPLQPSQGDKLTSTPYSHCSSGCPAPRGHCLCPRAPQRRGASAGPPAPRHHLSVRPRCTGTAPRPGLGAALPRPCPAAMSLCPPAQCLLWGAATGMDRNGSVPTSQIHAGPQLWASSLLPASPAPAAQFMDV